MNLEVIEFVGGPACGRRYKVGRVREFYEHEIGGEVHAYRTERGRHGGTWAVVHEGLKRGVR